MWKFLIVALLTCPVITVITLALWSLMPDCTGGDSGYPSGCYLLGINLNWAIQIGILASLGAMLTMTLIPYLVITIIIVATIYWMIRKIFNLLPRKNNSGLMDEIKFKIPGSGERRVLHK